MVKFLVSPQALPEWGVFHGHLPGKVGRGALIVRVDGKLVWTGLVWIRG